MIGPDVEDRDDIRWVRFNRPEKRNALRPEDVQGVRDAVRDVAKGCRGIVFCGTGGDFSSGNDVSGFKARDVVDVLESGAALSPGLLMLQEVRTCPLPTVAAIEGYCVGLAMDLTAVCDIRVASRTAQFSMPEVKIGLPVVADASLFAQYVGLAKAKEMLLTGRYYSGDELNKHGFINELTEPGEAEAAAERFAKELGALPPRTIASQKRIFEAWLQLPHREATTVSILEYAITVAHPETVKWIEEYRAK